MIKIKMLLVMLFIFTKAQAQNNITLERLKLLDNYMSHVADFGFSGQVLIAEHDGVLFSKSYGYANEETDQEVDNQTIFGIASISKQFTAAAILKLVQQNKLSTDRKLVNFFSDVPADKKDITIHHLLTHTSGLPGGDLIPDFADIDRDSLLALIMEEPLASTPGESWAYSNAGYNLLAIIIEKTTDKLFSEYLSIELFEPAAMRNTGIVGIHKWSTDGAHSYRDYIDYGDVTDWEYNLRTLGGGNIASTAEDLFKWKVALKKEKILTKRSTKLFFDKYVPIVSDSTEWYGYGWFVLPNTPYGSLVEHGGDTDLGFNGMFENYIDNDITLIMLNNRTRTFGWAQWMRWAVTDSIKAILFKKIYENTPSNKPLKIKNIEEFTGKYRFAEGGFANVKVRAKKLLLNLEGQEIVSRFWVPDSLMAKSFIANKKTEDLFADLLQGLIYESYSKALKEDGKPFLSDYLTEWNNLLEKYGPFKKYEVIGTVKQPFDSRMRSYVHLVFENGNSDMWLSWTENGSGRLSGTRVENGLKIAGFIKPVRDDQFIWYDPFSKRKIRFSLEEDKVLKIIN